MKKTKKIYGFLNNFSAAFNRKNISDFAASAAFFLFLSLIPIMVLVISILPYTFLTEKMLLGIVLRAVPEVTDTFVTDIITEIYAGSYGVVTVSIVITLWSAGKAMQSMIRGLNGINDIEENRSYFVLRALACLYTIALLIAMIIMMGILMFGRIIVNFALRHLPQLEEFRGRILLFRYPISLALLIILFTAIYCLVPSKKQRFTKQLPGAIFAGVTWSAASWIFSTYLNMFNGFSTYGSMATIIIIMFYMYMMMYIILVGAYINRWLGRSEGHSPVADDQFT
ncbi:MAG: YihY/virulence factor BrkB family protein [Lachnospiraceae bacterium]|nr:YihY/virulence factor BrkB family protein [Lachnospiraceae bacterium]